MVALLSLARGLTLQPGRGSIIRSSCRLAHGFCMMPLRGFYEVRRAYSDLVLRRSIHSSTNLDQSFNFELHEVLKDTLRRIEPEKNIIHAVKRKVTKILRARLDRIRILTNVRRDHQSV